MSSTKRKLLRYYPSIIKPVVFHASFRNMLPSVAISSLGFPCCSNHLLVLIMLFSRCRWTVIELLVYMSFRCSMYMFSVYIAHNWSKLRYELNH